MGPAGTPQDRHEWTRAGTPAPLLDRLVFRDVELSYEARGLFGELVLLKDGEKFSAESLAAGTPNSVTTVRTALAELAAAGYLEQVAR